MSDGAEMREITQSKKYRFSRSIVNAEINSLFHIMVNMRVLLASFTLNLLHIPTLFHERNWTDVTMVSG